MQCTVACTETCQGQNHLGGNGRDEVLQEHQQANTERAEAIDYGEDPVVHRLALRGCPSLPSPASRHKAWKPSSVPGQWQRSSLIPIRRATLRKVQAATIAS